MRQKIGTSTPTSSASCCSTGAQARRRNLTEQWDRSAEQLAWSPDSRSLVGSIDDAGTRRLYRFELKVRRQEGTAPRVSPPLDPKVQCWSRSVRASLEPPTVVSVNARSGAATKLSTFNDAALANIRWGKVESASPTKGAQER